MKILKLNCAQGYIEIEAKPNPSSKYEIIIGGRIFGLKRGQFDDIHNNSLFVIDSDDVYIIDNEKIYELIYDLEAILDLT